MVSSKTKKTNFRWSICALLFLATTINYLDRQVLSLTWTDFIKPEFHWDDNDYGNITAIFSFVYALSMLLAGRFVDRMGTKKGFLWAIGIWSLGACLHAYCGIATAGIIEGTWFVGFERAKEMIGEIKNVSLVVSVSVGLFMAARCILALGEAGNFPAAIKATAEYFPKKDRAFATSIFNAGATVGALGAPLTIPFIAARYGWETAFLIIGGFGFVWMGIWVLFYKKPAQNPWVNDAELAYIEQDKEEEESRARLAAEEVASEPKISFWKSFTYRQTWSFILGKFMTDGVWWFFLFWTPAYLKSVYKLSATESAPYIFVLYLITLLSIIGGWLPSYFVGKGMNPYAGRMKSMFIFALIPLSVLLAQPLGVYSIWLPVCLIGLAAAAHQAWSANIFSTVGDMFPKSLIATITGIGGMAGGIGAALIQKVSGVLFVYSEKTQLCFMGFEGIEAGYFIIFSFCSVAYLLGWSFMKLLVPKYKLVEA